MPSQRGQQALRAALHPGPASRATPGRGAGSRGTTHESDGNPPGRASAVFGRLCRPARGIGVVDVFASRRPGVPASRMRWPRAPRP